MKAVTYFAEIGPRKKRRHKRMVKHKCVWGKYTSGFSDGNSQQRRCSCGAFIVLEPGCYYHFWQEGGQGTNSRAEIIALWGVLLFAKWLRLEQLRVHGDAKSIIDWVKEYTLFSPTILSYQMKRKRTLVSTFQSISFQHIYREQNQVADQFSKSINTNPAKFFFAAYVQDALMNAGTINFSQGITICPGSTSFVSLKPVELEVTQHKE